MAQGELVGERHFYFFNQTFKLKKCPLTQQSCRCSLNYRVQGA
jgi:hypothetical protein